MPELLFSGWKVEKKDATPLYTLQNSYQFIPHVKAIADRLEQAYKMQGSKDYSKRARYGAMEYDIRRVVEKHWKPVLANIEKKLQESPASDNLSQNLQVLR